MAGIINLSVRKGLKETEQSVRTHGRVSGLKVGTCPLGFGWCIEWLGDGLNLLRLKVRSMFLGTGNDLVIDYDQGKDKSLKKTTSKRKI